MYASDREYMQVLWGDGGESLAIHLQAVPLIWTRPKGHFILAHQPLWSALQVQFPGGTEVLAPEGLTSPLLHSIKFA